MWIPLSSNLHSYQKYQIRSCSDLLGGAKSMQNKLTVVIMKARNSEINWKYY